MQGKSMRFYKRHGSKKVNQEITNSKAIKKWITIILFIVTGFAMSGCGTAPPDDILQKSGQAAIVFVKENSRENNRSNAMRSNRDEF